MVSSPFRHGTLRDATIISGLCCVLFAFAGTAQELASEPPPQPTTNLVTGPAVSLVAKTPLGDAAIEIPPGTVLTDYEVQGERVKIWRGPFTAMVDLDTLQPAAEEPAVAATAPTAASAGAPVLAATPTPSSSPVSEEAIPSPTMPHEPVLAPVPAAEPEQREGALAVSAWLLPAAVGALATYALFATALLFRSRRRSNEPRTAIPAAAKAPTVTIPSTTAPKPAVVADGGSAIACPLCGKSIPLDKVTKGRNRCLACHGSFVGE